jgi:hypothetical protein
VRSTRGTRLGTVAAGLTLLAAVAPAVAAQATWRTHVLACFRHEGWLPVARTARTTILAAQDGHAEMQLVFWSSGEAARRSIPNLAPIGVGWVRRLSYRAGSGFTIADEQTIYRCAR